MTNPVIPTEVEESLTFLPHAGREGFKRCLDPFGFAQGRLSLDMTKRRHHAADTER